MLTQFPPESFKTRFWTFLRTEETVGEALAGIREEGGLILHAIVSAAAKEKIAEFCRVHRIPCKDLTGGFVEFLAENSGLIPSADWRDLHKVDEAYQRRIQAVEFALQHDDGLGLDSISEADVVLVGISRTGKTPTSVYLSQLGYRAANVSLAIGIDPPAQLLSLPKGKVVALVIDSTRLTEIRRRRRTDMGMGSSSYDASESVQEELAWSRKLFGRQGWPVLDVTNSAIEETAGRILDLLNLPRNTRR